MTDETSMNITRTIAIFLALTFFVLWCVPFWRSIEFYQEAQDYFYGTRSTDSWNDLNHSVLLLISYGFSSCSALGTCWLIFRQARIFYLLPISLHTFVIVELLRFSPESPIVFIPDMTPIRPAIISFIAISMSVLCYCAPPNPPKKINFR